MSSVLHFYHSNIQLDFDWQSFIAQAAPAAKATPEVTKSPSACQCSLTFLPAWVADQKGFLEEDP
jgi:hypothetical protein